MSGCDGRSGRVSVRVRYAETDQMGRAHHGTYLVWCELGRTALMRDAGISYAELEQQGILLPVSRVEIAYRRPVTYDERVVVLTSVTEVRSRSVQFTYEIRRKGDEALLATAITDLACAAPDGRARRLPAEVRGVLVGLRDET